MFAIVTYGPFAIETSGHRFSADSFWSSLTKAKADLANMFGIYIFARKIDGVFVPIYVGKTMSPYVKRLNGHFKSSTILTKIDDFFPGEALHLFLIAVTSPKKGAAAKSTESRSTWVNFLETALIAECKALNKNLQNDKKTLLNGRVCVPGFLGDNPSTRDEAAKALALMLKPAVHKSKG